MEELDNTALVSEIQDQFVFFLPAEKFLLWDQETNEWLFDRLLSQKGLLTYLVSARRYPADVVKELVQKQRFRTVEGIRMDPDAGPLVTVGRRRYVNLYVPPTLEPKPGDWPRIHRVLDWFTQDDPAGKDWLINWLAAKVQNPLFLPKVAVVFSTKPGAGKGTLAKIVAQMIGPRNFAEITHRNLTNRFNERWIFKLFVLADEILTRETMESTSETLKVLIDASKIELEKKGQDQREVSNHLAWMFASNDDETPVVVEAADRRYTVFTNFAELPPDYVSMVESLYLPESREPTPEFMDEIAGFYHHLKSLVVDFRAAAKPYQNESRRQLIEASKPSHALFMDHVKEPGALDELLDHIADNDQHLRMVERGDWDRGEEVSTLALFRAYLAFCDRENIRYRVKATSFGRAAKNAGWIKGYPKSNKTGKQFYTYRGPWIRVPKETKTGLRAVGTT